MLHILLLILKILLITVLVLIGLAVLLLIIILCVPVRYRVYAQKYESILAKVKVSFLGFVLCFKGIYDENGFNYKLKTFGGTLMESDNGISDNTDGNNNQVDEPKEKKHKKRKKDSNSALDDNTDSLELHKEDDATMTGALDNEFDEHVVSDNIDTADKEFLLNDSDFKADKPGLFTRIGAFIDKAVKGIKDKASSIATKFGKLKDKAETYKKFLDKTETKASIQVVKKCIIRILKHIVPTRIKGSVLYGAKDPATTGQHLAYLSIAFPLYCDKIDITPDFSRKVLEGNISLKGRIRIISLLSYALKVLLNKNIRITIKRFKSL